MIFISKQTINSNGNVYLHNSKILSNFAIYKNEERTCLTV